MVICIRDFVDYAHTNQEGDIILNQIAPSIYNGEVVVVSFKGISSVTSSFLNSAFIPLLDRVPFSELKNRMKFIDSNRTINDSILRRFRIELELIKA